MNSDERLIPGFSRYSITREGTLCNVLTGKEISGSTNPAGYVNFRIHKDGVGVVTLGRHRAICLAFIPEGFPDEKYVNHINGVKGDDRLENLEWVTPRENVEHAGNIGISSKCIPIEVRELPEGIVRKFPSFLACANYYGMSKDAIALRANCKLQDMRVYPEKRQYRRASDDARWYDPPWGIDHAIRAHDKSKACVVLDLQSGDETLLFSGVETAKFLGITESRLSQILKLDHDPVVNGKYLVKLERDGRPWGDPVKSRKKLEVFARSAKTGEITKYISARECCREHNLKPTALSWRLRHSSETIYPNGYSYATCPTVWKHTV